MKGRTIPVRVKKIRKDHLGYTTQDPREIVLQRSSPVLLETLVHEMVHQLDFRLSEDTVLRLEAGIVAMVRENPELFLRLSTSPR